MRWGFTAVALLAVATPALANDCNVSPAQREAARQLSWQVFDQQGGAPGTFRDLSAKQCYSAALEAYRDWLTNSPGFANERERAIGTFHIAQMLAFLGETETAVRLFGQAIRTDETLDENPDQNAIEWNLYVTGTLAFFAGERDAVSAAIASLQALDTRVANRWKDRLTGLRRCLKENYRAAMSPRCQAK